MSKLLTTAEAAQALGLNRRQVLRLAARGDLSPALKMPGSTGAYLFTAEEVESAGRMLAAAAHPRPVVRLEVFRER